MMKTKQISTLFLLIFVTIFSCDELDELTEFDVSDSFSTSFVVSLDAEDPTTINTVETIDITSNQDIQDNLDAIQDININSMTYEVANYSGADDITVTGASLMVSGTTINIEDVNLKQADDNNTIYTISNSQQLNTIANVLQSAGSVTIVLVGTVSDVPVRFDLNIDVSLTATVDVL